MKISRILHAGYVFECDQSQIAFDPIFENPFSRNCFAFPNVEFDNEKIKSLQFDAVFISHFHDDHLSLESLNYLNRDTPIYLYCLFEEFYALIKQLGFKNVHALSLNVTVRVGPFEVTPWPALDVEVDSLFQLKAAGLNVLNVVDSWIDPLTIKKLKQVGPWDMVMWPFQTMREIEVLAPSRALPADGKLPLEWIEQIKELNPRYVVPSSCQLKMESWSWYNHAFFPISYEQFKNQIAEELPDLRVLRMNPSVTILLDKGGAQISAPLTWINPIGEQDLDYEYIENSTPPPTSEIAQHFPALTQQQTDRVYNYLEVGLLEKFRSLAPLDDGYFKVSRWWQLSVYDHTGTVRHFKYRLDKNNIKYDMENHEPVSWLTEVAIAKLYAALEWGESLTSMYLRINDRVFSKEIETEIQNADVIEDPLIRCLFHGAIASYQEAQLKKIKTKFRD